MHHSKTTEYNGVNLSIAKYCRFQKLIMVELAIDKEVDGEALSLYTGQYKVPEGLRKLKTVETNVSIVQQLSFPMASTFSDRFRGLLDEMLEPESAKLVK